MTISVVIPSYNSASFLRETLSSIFAQTLQPTEIIIVDDCSTDGTPQAVQDWRRSNSAIPIRFFQTTSPSGGPAVPLNLGIAESKGEYLALLDHDDMMEPRKLELQLRTLRQSPQALLSFGDYTEFGGSSPGGIDQRIRGMLLDRSNNCGDYHLVPPDAMLQLQILYPGLVQSCSNLLFHRSLWPMAGPFDANITAICDYAFKLRAAPLSFATFIPLPLFRKRVHAENLFTRTLDRHLVYKINLVKMNAVKHWPRYTIRSRQFRRYYKEFLQETMQSRWWHDDYRAVGELWLQGLQVLGAEFLADSMRWLFWKVTTKLRSKVFRSH